MPSLSAFSRLTTFFLAGGLFLTGQIALVCMTGLAPRLRGFVESSGLAESSCAWVLLALPLAVFVGFLALGVDEAGRHFGEHRRHRALCTRQELTRQYCERIRHGDDALWLMKRHRLSTEDVESVPQRLPQPAIWDLEGHAIAKILAVGTPGVADRLVRVQFSKQLAGAYLVAVSAWWAIAMLDVTDLWQRGYFWRVTGVTAGSVAVLWWVRNWNHEFFWRFAFRLAMTLSEAASAPDRRESPVA